MKGMGPLPQAFQAVGGRLQVGGKDYADGMPVGRPLFAYDRAIIRQKVAEFRAAMPEDIALHYAVKANPFGPVLSELSGLVDGFDLASSGELERLRQIGRKGLPLSLAGPGKSDADLMHGLENGITFHVESEHELERLLAKASESGLRPRVGVRVNPPFGLKGSGMKMGGLASPFGIDHDRVPGAVHRILDAGAEWRGLHVYAGSQSLHADAIIDAQRTTLALAAEIATAVGSSPPEVNLGGGFGIPYFAGDQPLDIGAIGAALKTTLDARPEVLRDTKFVIELGRWLVGESGVYMTRVVDRKVSRGKTFLVVDGGLHHMLAASGNFGQLLRRNYPVAIADRFDHAPEEVVSIVGCLCTPLDLLADEVSLPRAEVGDVIAIFCAGAYGLTASPVGFLSQPVAHEALV